MQNRKWLLIAWTIYTFTFLIQILLVWEEDSERLKFVWANLISGYIICSFLIITFIIPLHHYLRKYYTRKKLTILFIAGFFFTLIYITFTTALMAVILGKYELSWFKTEFYMYLKFSFHNVLKTYIFLSVLLFAMEYFRRESALIKREGDLQHRLLNAQLQNLRSQFQPHFLFNALNSVVAVIDEKKDKAQEMLVQLSDILRISIDNSYDCEHSLKEELEFIIKYLSIEKIRFEDQLEFSFQVDSQAEQMKIPCLILQPLVENCIKHGYKRNKNKKLSILISASQNGLIRIMNNGSKLNEFSCGNGVRNVKERLSAIYGEKGTFKLYQAKEWTVNELYIEWNQKEP